MIESGEIYKLIVENVNDLVAVINQDISFEYVNENVYKKLTGYSSKDLIGEKVLNYVHYEDHRKILYQFDNLFKTGINFTELRFKHKDGHYMWIETNGKQFKDKDGKIKALTISRDITDRKRAEAKLRDSEEKYRLISENANEIITVQNDKFQIEYVNEGALKNILGYSVKDIIGKTSIIFAHPDDRKDKVRSFNKKLKRGKYPYQSRYKHKDGHYIWLEITLESYHNTKGEKKYLTISRDISTQKEFEFLLKKSELSYSNLLETLDVGFYQVTLDGKMLKHNKAHNIILGYEPMEDLRTKDMRQFWQNPEDRDEYIRVLLKDGFTKNYICHSLKKDGEKIIVELNSYLIRDDGGNPIRIDGTFSDITDNFRLEQRLKESEQKYLLITENVSELISVFDKNFKLVYINENQKNISGFSFNEIIGKEPKDFIHKDDIERYKSLLMDLIKNGLSKGEFRLRNKKDNYYWLEIDAKKILNYNKEINYIVVSRNIHQRRLAETKLRESEEKYRLISESANDLIRVLNDRFEIEYINENVHKRLLGYSKEDLIGQTYIPFIHPEDLRHAIRSTVKNLKRGKGSYEARFKDKYGNYLWFEFAGKYFYDSKEQKKILSIARDINERKLAEDRLRKSEKKYRKAYNSANFYKDIFAHDINNILHIINSSAELISYHLGDSEKSKVINDISNIIKKQVDRGAKLVSNITILSELEEVDIHTKPTDLNKIMDQSIEFVNKAYEDKDINISIAHNEDHLIADANELLIDVFDNILINSIKYNEHQNIEITINAARTQVNGSNYIRMEFSDNGIGVPDDRKEIIFKRGNREIKGSKGMGIGLSLVKKIIKGYKGKIWVEDKFKNDYSKGSKFILLIPEYVSN